MLQLSDADFQRLVTFMHERYGINLSQKRLLINSRLSTTLQAKGYTDFTAFVDELLSGKDPAQMEFVLNKLTTNYTYFMREKDHFDFFTRVALPEIIRRNEKRKVLSIWSAGCSTGEEPYTISMCIKDYLGAKAASWDTRVLATDISPRVLGEAADPSYQEQTDIPPEWHRRYFQKRTDGSGLYTVTPEIRKNVIFRVFNLMDPIRFRLKFDVIFCRNVMIYFDQATKDALVQRFYDATNPGGYLMIGHSENISKSSPYHMLRPATFRKEPADARGGKRI